MRFPLVVELTSFPYGFCCTAESVGSVISFSIRPLCGFGTRRHTDRIQARLLCRLEGPGQRPKARWISLSLVQDDTRIRLTLLTVPFACWRRVSSRRSVDWVVQLMERSERSCMQSTGMWMAGGPVHAGRGGQARVLRRVPCPPPPLHLA